MTRTQLILYLEYILLFIVIALTGFEYFFRSSSLFYFTVLPISSFLFIHKGFKINYQAFRLTLVFTFIFFLQSYKFGMSYTLVFTGFIRVLAYYFTASAISDNFKKIFVNLIYFISVISLIFYFGTIISSSFYNVLLSISKNIQPIGFELQESKDWSNPSQSLILYTVPLVHVLRNNGPFWEPGMFAVFINIALVINMLDSRKLFNKIGLILFIASITTLSTTSLISTFVITVYYFIFIKRSFISLAFIFSLPFILPPIYNSSVIKGNIEHNFATIERSDSRFGAALLHWKQISNSPIIGYGAYVSEDQEKILKNKSVSPNGLTNIIRFFGIPFSLLLYIQLFKFSRISINQFANSHRDVLLLFSILLIVAFSQDITTRHFYFILMFFPVSYYNGSLSFNNNIS